MYKLFVLAALLAIAAARPSYLESSPLIYSAAPAVHSVAVHEPTYAHVGSVVKSIPTAVSHQSISQVHSSAHVVQPIVAPVVKTYAAAAPILHSAHYAAPLLNTYSAASPVAYTHAHAPALTYAASPLTYGAGHYANW